MSGVLPLLLTNYSTGLSFSILTSTVNTSTILPVPTGAAIGDMLLVVLTNGLNATKGGPAGFTVVATSKAGWTGYRSIVSGDIGGNITLPASDYAVAIVIKKSFGTIASWNYGATATSSSNGAELQSPSNSWASTSATLSYVIDIFYNSSSAIQSPPQKTTTNLIPYNVQGGNGGCGIAITGNSVPPNTLNSFYPNSCVQPVSSSSYPQQAVSIQFF